MKAKKANKKKPVARGPRRLGKKKPPPRRRLAPTAGVDLRMRVAELERQVKVAERLRFESLRPRKDGAKVPFDATTFVAGIAHEFNNILGAADGHAEWALESGTESDMREALQVIRTACQRSARITKSLQGLVQPREESKALFALRPLVAEVARLFKGNIERARVDAKFAVPQVNLYGDQGRILDVLVNLVKNSLESFGSPDFSGRLQPDFRPSLELSGKLTSSGPKALILLVKDNGPGVPGVFRDFIFQPFFTTKGAFAAALPAEGVGSEGAGVTGTGLGLYLARQIVEEHGGTLECLSSAVGASFEIRLPLT